MQQIQQIKGMSQQEMAHSIPITFIRQIQDRHRINQSLIQKCMKSIVKQKMSGNLINAERKKRALQFQPRQIKHLKADSLYGISAYLNTSVKGNRYQNPERNSLQKSFTNNQSKHRRNQSAIIQLDGKKVLFNKTKYRYALNQTQIITNKKQNKNEQFSKLSSHQKPIELSFISAIDHSDDENLQNRQSPHMRSSTNTSPTNKFRGSQIRLPKIKKNVNQASIKDFAKQLLSPTTIVKNMVKRSIEDTINQQFWKFLTTIKNQAQTKKRKTSSSLSDINQINLPSSVIKQKKTIVAKIPKPNLTRQKLLNYFQNLPPTFQRLIQFIVSFFEIKIISQITPQFYAGILSQIRSTNERIWSVVAFVFWDIKKLNVINLANIFTIFKQNNDFTDSEQQKKVIQQSKKEKKIKKKVQTQNEEQREQKNRRKSSIVIEKDNQKQKQKILQNIFKTLKIGNKQQTQANQQQCEKTSCVNQGKDDQRQTVYNLENVQKALKLFNSQIAKLNTLLSKNQQYTQICEDGSENDEQTVSYLEQVVLGNQNLKCKEVIPLFSAGDQKLNNKNEHKLQLFPRDLTVKCASSYKQCFIATEHNEQTRMIRQKIQNYKQQLKQKRKIKKKIIQQKIDSHLKLPTQLDYTKVAQSNMGEIVKTIVLHLLGYQF